MKISEIEKKLKEAKEKHGDIPVHIWKHTYVGMETKEINHIYFEDGELILHDKNPSVKLEVRNVLNKKVKDK
jgi:hypothetical protein